MVSKVGFFTMVSVMLLGQFGGYSQNGNQYRALSSEKRYQKSIGTNQLLTFERWIQYRTQTGYWHLYHSNGTVSAKGCFKHNLKEGYWYFYHPNDEPKKEGHYMHGSAQDWWIFLRYCQSKGTLRSIQKRSMQGYGFVFEKKKLTAAEKYKYNLKIGMWNTLRLFKNDNPNFSLQCLNTLLSSYPHIMKQPLSDWY